MKADGTTDTNAELAALCAKTTTDNPPIVNELKPVITIPNRVKLMANADTSIELKSITYRYVFTESKTAPDTKDASWIVKDATSSDDVTFKPNANLDYNKTYYLHVKGSYVKRDKDAPKTIEEVSEEAFATKTTFPEIFFKTADGLNEAGLVYDMKSEKTQIDKMKYLLPGHAVENTPAALKTTADVAGSSLKLNTGLKIMSHSGMYYSKGDLSFEMRLPGKTEIENLVNGRDGNDGKKFKLVNKDGKAITGFENAGTVDLATFTAGDVMVKVVYYAPTFKSDSADESGAVAAKWTLHDQGKVNVVVMANGKKTVATAAVLATSGVKLSSDTALDAAMAAAVTPAVNDVLFDANAWVAYQNCAITFVNDKITAKLGAASQEIALEKAQHIDIFENGYTNFVFEASKIGLRVKNVKYMVTK